jgi:hypothetical protein
MSLVLGYLEHEQLARETAAALEAKGTDVVLVHGDVREPETAEKLVAGALGRFATRC